MQDLLHHALDSIEHAPCEQTGGIRHRCAGLESSLAATRKFGISWTPKPLNPGGNTGV